jgi:hypothetical protein
MIILDDKCSGAEAALRRIFEIFLSADAGKKGAVGFDSSFDDFDDCIIIVKVENEAEVTVRLDWSCAQLFLQNGGKEAVENAFAGLVVEISGKGYSVKVKKENIPADRKARGFIF